MTEIFFENFSIPKLSIQTDVLLSLYLSNSDKSKQLNGLVIDSGDSNTAIVPVVSLSCNEIVRWNYFSQRNS